MQAWLFGVFDWLAGNKTAQAILFGIGVLLGLKSYGAWHAHMGRQRAEEKHRVESAKQHARMTEAAREIEQEQTDDAADARDAGDSLPEFRDADELRKRRPDLAAVVFGRGPRSGG